MLESDPKEDKSDYEDELLPLPVYMMKVISELPLHFGD